MFGFSLGIFLFFWSSSRLMLSNLEFFFLSSLSEWELSLWSLGFFKVSKLLFKGPENAFKKWMLIFSSF